jgi:deoxyribodipyrimidine photolyase
VALYVRIFNPEIYVAKFDPQSSSIRRWVAEPESEGKFLPPSHGKACRAALVSVEKK